MACSWGNGNTDFKFYQGSSSANAWTRDLLWKRSISDEAKLMGFKPNFNKNNPPKNATNMSSSRGSQVTNPPSPRRLAPMDTSLPLPSARSSSMQHHMQKMRQKLQTQETRQRAILARAQEMFIDRKKFGGTLNRKEATSWSTFMSTLKAPDKHISPVTGELDVTKSTVSQTRFDKTIPPRPRTSGSGTSRRNRFSQTRKFVANKNRKAANRAAIVAERKQLLQGGRAPPFWTTDVSNSQLGGRPSTVAQGLYGTPVDEIVPRYGSVTDLPVYDAPKYWEEEGELTCGEVLAPLPGTENQTKDMYKTAYNLSYKPDGNTVNEDEEEEAVQQYLRDVKKLQENEQHQSIGVEVEDTSAKNGERYVLIPEQGQVLDIYPDKIVVAATENGKGITVEETRVEKDESGSIIKKLEMEQKNIRLTARRSQTRGSSRKTARPSGMTGRPGTVM